MADILDLVTNYVDMFTTGQFPIPPQADTLGGHVPDLKGLTRDDDGIICQAGPVPLRKTFPPMPSKQGNVDGGDSAARTGAAAFCNSGQDIALLSHFESNGVMVRHPKHAPWNNPHNCSRDQLLAFSSGCWRAGRLDITQRLMQAHAVRGYTCQNYEDDEPGTTKKPPVGDTLLPDDIMYLHICAGESSTFMEPFGQLALQLAIQIADRSVEVDKTNLMLECIVSGRLNLFVQVHQDYEAMLRYYFVGDTGANRREARLAEELIWVVGQELKRYPSSIVPLLPMNTLKLLRGLNLNTELKNINPAHHADLAARFAAAALKDAASTFVNTMKYSLDVAAKQLKELGASANKIAKDLADAGRNPADITKALADIGTPPTDLNQAIHLAFPGVVVPPIPSSPIPVPPIPVPTPPIPTLNNPIPIPTIPKIKNPFH